MSILDRIDDVLADWDGSEDSATGMAAKTPRGGGPKPAWAPARTRFRTTSPGPA